MGSNKLAEEDVEQSYPWYEVVEASDELEQGDFIDNCEVFVPTYILNDSTNNSFTYKVEFRGFKSNVVVINQSCDLGSKKDLEHILVCPRNLLSSYIKPDMNMKEIYKKLEEMRKGQQYRYFMLHQSTILDYSCETQIVDLAKVYSIPYNAIKQMVETHDKRLRLCSPYKEKLAQAFGYYYMRIGLPIDIPEFSAKTFAQVSASSIQQK